MKYIIEIAICVTICIVVFFICDSKPRYRRKTKPIIMGVSIIFAKARDAFNWKKRAYFNCRRSL